ncbi:class I adenylate-forming enzyme family protein [Sphaerisporangium corydalis]|uniref:Class I adenylate-forming enzyme family protein n=1 Tax=Sphaerisporangium corydalis TaxID=1441875 RepID=A0ABV9EBI6_9ACTN|nr:class I adenylate-forming enzyme family protein [Sphaerisporangium corydalis]
MRLHAKQHVDHFTSGGWWTGDTVDRLFQDQVGARPSAVAIVDPLNKPSLMDGPARRLTWAELGAEVDRVAAVLLEAGVAQGEVVAVQLPNSVELAIAFLAVARIGAVVTPLPVQYREYELAQVIPLSGAKVLVTAERVGDRDNAEIVRRLELPAPPLVLAWGDPAGDLATATADPGLLAAHLKGLETDPNDCVTICWTSGTEATPKGVPRCHYDWFAVESNTTAAPALTGDDVVLNPFPMVNMAGIGGVFLPWLRTGFQMVQHHPFDLLVYLDQITEERVTYTLAPPALLTMLLQKPEMLDRYDISSLTRVGSGSAPLPPWMVKGWQDRYGISIINFFGSNEGIALLSDPVNIPDPEERARFFPRPGVPGGPATLAATRVKLVDPTTGEEVTEPGRPGELRLSGPTVFAGYLAGTAAADPFDEDGYLMTGDVFEIDGPGGRYLRYVDRAKDLVIRGGMNIAPAELESLLAAHPSVVEVAVIGYPDEVLGEKVCAVVAPRGDVDLASIVAFLREKGIASYKLPERLEIVEGLPRNALGKILKRELRERF